MKRILLVEDNENIMDINSKYLASQGYLVEKAATIREAKAVLFHTTPDLIVLDVMLPDGDGMELCNDIRRKSSIPILFLTAKAGSKDMIRGIDLGADDYLTKPYDLDVMGTRIRALLRRTSRILPSGQIFSLGPLQLNIIRAQALIDGQDLNLSGKEFGILLYLAQHQGQPVSKEALYCAVWGRDDCSNGTSIWPVVSRLKRKLEPFRDQLYVNSDHSGYELVIIRGGGPDPCTNT